MWLASRLSRGSAADCLNDECYINDEVGFLTFESICDSQSFETAWSWTDLEQDHIALEPLSQSVLSQRLSLAHAHRNLVRLDRVGFDATVEEERSRWAFSTVRGAALRVLYYLAIVLPLRKVVALVVFCRICALLLA